MRFNSVKHDRVRNTCALIELIYPDGTLTYTGIARNRVKEHDKKVVGQYYALLNALPGITDKTIRMEIWDRFWSRSKAAEKFKTTKKE